MIGLPHGIGVGSLPSVEQIILLTINCYSLMSQGQQRGIKLLDDTVDTIIAGDFPPPLPGNSADLTMDGSDGTWRGLQGQSFNERNGFGRQAARLPFVRTHLGIGQASQAVFTIAFDPSLDSALRDVVGTCDLRLGDTVFQGWSNDGKAGVCLCSLVP